MNGTASILRGDARRLPLPDNSVDLVVTSPPYYAQRSYTDGGHHYAGQIGDEATPREYIDALIECTREWVRVLKPGGSIFVNLGDKYARTGGVDRKQRGVSDDDPRGRKAPRQVQRVPAGIREKSLMDLPARYRIACVDELGLINRAVMIWSKTNAMPSSAKDRVATTHEDWVHLTVQPRYFAAVDAIREPHVRGWVPGRNGGTRPAKASATSQYDGLAAAGPHPGGALPGSVWEIATEPLVVPDELGVDHYACVDTDTEILTRRGWLRHDEVQVGDEVAGYDLDTGVTSWTRCHAVHRYDFDGELISVDGRGLSMRLTPNHRTLAHRYAGTQRVRQPVEVIRADELSAHHGVPRAVTWADNGREKSIGMNLAALCGWVAAEGWVTPGGRVYLCQSVTANQEHVDTIDALLSRIDLPTADRSARVTYRRSLDLLRRTVKERQWRGRPSKVATWALPLGLSQQIMGLLPGKMLTPSLVDLPLDEAAALLGAFVSADGHIRPDGRRAVFQKDRRNLDVLQVIAVRCGYNTTLRHSGGRWVLYLNPPRPARLRRADGTSLVDREQYRGVVWCVTTGTGTFLARRRGSVFVTGNSFPTEWPRRIIQGWSPSGICTACGEGRRPVTSSSAEPNPRLAVQTIARAAMSGGTARSTLGRSAATAITGEACACPDTSAPTRPSVVLDPFGGTGTTALVAKVLGRHGITVDMSADYCRLARWRTTDPVQLAKAARVAAPPKQLDGQGDLFADLGVVA